MITDFYIHTFLLYRHYKGKFFKNKQQIKNKINAIFKLYFINFAVASIKTFKTIK